MIVIRHFNSFLLKGVKMEIPRSPKRGFLFLDKKASVFGLLNKILGNKKHRQD